jgi:hypothetical protein
MYRYVLVCESTALHVLPVVDGACMCRYIPVCTKQELSKHGIYQYIVYCIKDSQRVDSFSLWGHYFRSIHGGIHFPQHITSWCFKCKIIHFLASSVRNMYIQVHGIYCHVRIHTKVTTTFHFESGLIRLATLTSFQSKLEPFIACSILPLCSILHRQTTQAGLAAPQLPQPGVNLKDIAVRLPSSAAASAGRSQTGSRNPCACSSRLS